MVPRVIHDHVIFHLRAAILGDILKIRGLLAQLLDRLVYLVVRYLGRFHFHHHALVYWELEFRVRHQRGGERHRPFEFRHVDFIHTRDLQHAEAFALDGFASALAQEFLFEFLPDLLLEFSLDDVARNFPGR